MANLLRAIATRIGLWPSWLKIVSIGVVALLVVAAVAVPVTLRLRARPAATAHRSPANASPAGTFLSPGADSLVADLTCRLPISSNAPGSGGFVGFPTAEFTSDPGSNTSDATRYEYGGLTYDRAVHRWLSVRRSAITPDGTRFVYWSGRDSDFHLVSASSGAETPIGPRLNGPGWYAASAARFNWASGGPPWGLLEAAADGAYAVPPATQTPFAAGLWFFPYAGTSERQIASGGYWQNVGGGAAWGTGAPSVPQGATVTILRLDLGTGVTTAWFSQDGEFAQVAGFDADGHPVVVTSTEDAFQVWLVDGQMHGTELLNLPKEPPKPGYGEEPPIRSVIGDVNGVWMAASDGLYLYRRGRTQKVSTVTGQIGGGCGA
ncbi:MAG TPA: hypothetical protein VE953_22575 [Terriglobales bacterium]|nr:hypothetical protein [Terriglobales bacterium]